MADIVRRKHGRGFTYTLAGTPVKDAPTLQRIQDLHVPPAWHDVRIATSPRAKVLAKGTDDAGRIQAIYNPRYRSQQEKAKFDRILRFASALPALRRQVEKDLARKRLSREKVVACAVKLMDEAYFRVGNNQYAKEHQTYGITTMRSKHITVSGYTVTFDFVGKSQQQHHNVLHDRQLARIMQQLDEQPGRELFRYQKDDGTLHTITSNEVNTYIKHYMGDEFTAKDFRTWGGTLLATIELMGAKLASSERERRKIVTTCVKKVAKRLGNTPAVARSSYIDPRVITAYTTGTTLQKVQKTMATMRPKKYLSSEEQCVLQLLRT